MAIDQLRSDDGHRPFYERHIGPTSDDVKAMMETIGVDTLDELVEQTIPASIYDPDKLGLSSTSESEVLDRLRTLGQQNSSTRSFMGMGYRKVEMPPPIQRYILENPQWYTHYTPYQSPISQGRLEALLNFQSLVSDMTGLQIANASLLDEATAAAEAMTMMYSNRSDDDRSVFVVAEDCHPQTIAVLRTRAKPLDFEIDIQSVDDLAVDEKVFGILFQYPATDGRIRNYGPLCSEARDRDILVGMAADPLALTMLEAPGQLGADVAVGTTQRFGVPVGFGGPHAAYFATRPEFKRSLPGRLVGVTKDTRNEPALRLALQTREQHIRRERATSNICTAQVLLAVIASSYAVYHGPDGLHSIAKSIHSKTRELAKRIQNDPKLQLYYSQFFDTLRISTPDPSAIVERADARDINLREYPDNSIGLSLDEATTRQELDQLFEVFERDSRNQTTRSADRSADFGQMERKTPYLNHPTFEKFQSETRFSRYIHGLANKDFSLTDGMIPLGSCTMKLNGAAELAGLSMPEFMHAHPFEPLNQNAGYEQIFDELEAMLAEITGLPAVCLQPNSGAQGEYAGLLAIRAFHRDRNGEHRDICLIPESAHGTNAASASMAGMEPVTVDCDETGNIDNRDLKTKCEKHASDLAGIMVTYPSTHGVFETNIEQVIETVHDHGGLVYLDGANMNAQIGLSSPAEYGVDICHLNLHKTFSIPHGGGGPGMGPVCSTQQLAPYLPNHPFGDVGGDKAPGPVSAAPWGSASILTISWAYIKLMGQKGLTKASKTAVLAANYMKDRLEPHYPILFTGQNERVAHEFVVDLRPFRRKYGITAQDVAKRLIDYGFHAPTMSWPVYNTLMIEPTESESKKEIDRFCEALISIRKEIHRIEDGQIEVEESPLRNAPHTSDMIAKSDWDRCYTRDKAVFPGQSEVTGKYWPPIGRVDDAYGDRNLRCRREDVDKLRRQLDESE